MILTQLCVLVLRTGEDAKQSDVHRLQLYLIHCSRGVSWRRCYAPHSLERLFKLLDEATRRQLPLRAGATYQ